MNFKKGDSVEIDVNARGLNKGFIKTHGTLATVVREIDGIRVRIKMKDTGFESGIKIDWLIKHGVESEAEEL